jgi:tRNA1Val (adenine37-N6)-methyltransferase
MASTYFDFKQFRVYHQHCAMKVGTDSVVLGAIIPLFGSEQTILDIGTGSGLLALMLAQRSIAQIDAIEIDEAASKEVQENFVNSPWNNRLQVTQIALQDFQKITSKQYDLIISNPPYFEAGKNYSIHDLQRSKARHDGDLSFVDLVSGVMKLLKETGHFWLILPVDEAINFKAIARNQELFLSAQIEIVPRDGMPVKRVVQGYTKKLVVEKMSSQILLTSNHSKTESYYDLTKDFYLDNLDSR